MLTLIGSTNGGGDVITSRQLISTEMNFTGATRDVAISSVDTNYVLMEIRHDGQNGGGANREVGNFEITSSTNVRITKQDTVAGSANVDIYIYEIEPSLVKSNQFLSDTDTSGQRDITITSVNTATSIISNHGIDSDKSSFGGNDWRAQLTSSTNARIFGVSGGGSSTVRGQVLELY